MCERSQAQMALLSVLLCGLWMKLLAYSICELHTNRRQRPLHRNSDHHHPVCLFTLLATPPNKVFAQDAYASAVTYLCSGLRTSDVCVHARACSLVCLFIRLLLWYCGLWPSFTRQDTCMQVVMWWCLTAKKTLCPIKVQVRSTRSLLTAPITYWRPGSCRRGIL